MTKKSVFRNNSSDLPVIGVVFPFLWTNKWVESLCGIDDAAKAFNVNILLFQGIYFNKQQFDLNTFSNAPLDNSSFDILNNIKIDAIILNSSLTGIKEYKQKLLDYCLQFKDIPIVNIGSTLPGVCNCLVNNKHGIRLLMEHIVHEHGITDIGFLRGPLNHIDTEQRLEAYKEFLKENNIQFRDDFISEPASFETNKAADSVERLLKSCNHQIKALICCSDGQARGAVKRCTDMGIRVPEDIIITGFNNDFHSSMAYPEITSIDYNLYERGWNAVETIIDYFKNKTLPNEVISNTSIVIRRSCGCISMGARAVEISRIESIDSIKNRDSIIDSMVHEICSVSNLIDTSLVRAWAESIFDSLLLQINNESEEIFIPEFTCVVKQFIEKSKIIDSLHYGLNCLQRHLDSIIDVSKKTSAIRYIDRARISISEIDAVSKTINRIFLSQHNTRVNSLSLAFTNSDNFNNVLAMLTKELPFIGVSSCYLSLYEDILTDHSKSRLHIAYNNQGKIELPDSGLSFNTDQILPDSIKIPDECRMLVFEPLFYGDYQLGFTLLEFSSYKTRQFSQLPAQLSTALWNGYLCQKEIKNQIILAQQAEELALKNAQLTQKSMQIETAYNELMRNHKKLVHAEKLVAQGHLTAVLAHELNTPLASAGASLMKLKQLFDEYTSSIGDPDVKPDDFLEIANELISTSQLALQSLDMAIDFTCKINTSESQQLQNNNTFRIH